MTSPLAAAQFYIDRGLLPIPVPHGQKKAIIQGWPSLRLTKQTAPMHFNGVPANVGILLGDDTGTTDVDLDAAEAVVVRAEFLPDTGFVFGRKSKPASHHFYRCDPPVRTKKFLDPINKACLVELRCQKNDGDIGFQTVVPPSLHPSGEPIRFESGCTYVLANVDAEVLQTAVTKIAAASLLVRHWPPEQAGRNAAFIALAGALARAGWSLEDALAFHRAIYRALWGPQADLVACKAELVATYEKHGRGFETTGKRTLSEPARIDLEPAADGSPAI
jgi:hypothetical protein